jgi:hypothetical protein
MCIWRGPDWAWGHVRVEALLASRTVYGDLSDVEDLRRDAQVILQEGLASLQCVSSLVDRIRSRIALVKTFEVCIFFTSVQVDSDVQREGIFQADDSTSRLPPRFEDHCLYSRYPDWHVLRTMLRFYGVKVAAKLRPVLSRELPDYREINLSEEDFQFWRLVWEHAQDSSSTMHTFDTGVSWGPKCIHHMLAQMQIAQAFDLGHTPDPTLYERVVR